METLSRFDQDFIAEVKERFPGVKAKSCSFLPFCGVHGWHLRFANGFLASIQFGPGTYSANHDDKLLALFSSGQPPEVPLMATAVTAEIAGWYKDGAMIQFPGWESEVRGWVMPQEVIEWLDRYALTAEEVQS